ncbi:hypothetical protein VWY69_00195 [Phaeobacter sp. A90a-4k]|uniref:hypothetical protein n=1 Tax=unclassified Phaeobacter TaxID=2621772 RepID=UPI003A83C8BE
MWKKKRVITSDAVPLFIQKGGKLEYRPVHTPKGWNWELWAISPDAPDEQVISSKTGEPRVFKSADALLSFHMRLHPGAKGMFIPAPISATSEEAEVSED